MVINRPITLKEIADNGVGNIPIPKGGDQQWAGSLLNILFKDKEEDTAPSHLLPPLP